MSQNQFSVSYTIPVEGGETRIVQNTHAETKFNAERRDFSGDEVKGWSIGGQPIDSADLLQRLMQTKHVLIVPPEVDYAAVVPEPYFLSFLRSDLIVIRVPSKALPEKKAP